MYHELHAGDFITECYPNLPDILTAKLMKQGIIQDTHQENPPNAEVSTFHIELEAIVLPILVAL